MRAVKAVFSAAVLGACLVVPSGDAIDLPPIPTIPYFDDLPNPFLNLAPPKTRVAAPAPAPRPAIAAPRPAPAPERASVRIPAPDSVPIPVPVKTASPEKADATPAPLPPATPITEDNAAQVAQETLERDHVFTLSDQLQVAAQFGYGASTLSPAFLKAVEGIADYMKAHPDRCPFLSVVGHADKQPGENMALSQDRAGTLANALAARGIAYTRIRERGMGDRAPLIANARTPEQYAQNRRVEVRCMKQKP